MNKTLALSAQITSFIFHPLLIPTIGFLLLFNSGFYFALIPWTIKQYILLVVFLSTGVLPALSIALLSMSPKFNSKMDLSTDRVLPLIISSIFYYTGYLILKRVPLFPIYQLFLLASILVQIALLIVSLRWKISAHAAAIGGLLGGFISLSFRLQENPSAILIALILIAGSVGTARILLEKHNNAQVYSGFLTGFLIMDFVFYFI